jgi:hypothetical protein
VRNHDDHQKSLEYVLQVVIHASNNHANGQHGYYEDTQHVATDAPDINGQLCACDLGCDHLKFKILVQLGNRRHRPRRLKFLIIASRILTADDMQQFANLPLYEFFWHKVEEYERSCW